MEKEQPRSMMALSEWMKRNNVVLDGVAISSISEKGLGVLATGENPRGERPLMIIPQNLILCLDSVWTAAKSDPQLQKVLLSVGEYSRTTRGAVLIFLLSQLTNRVLPESEKVGISSAFSDYLKFLPLLPPLPTCWRPMATRALLAGTSLQDALDAKLTSLEREFETLRNATSSIDWCQEHWWDAEKGCASLELWLLVDAMYRSRALDLPGFGHAMVPCIDMVNHASGGETSALFGIDAAGNVALVLREGKSMQPGEEVTISYGDEKGASEMLHSYGFIEDTMESARAIYLDLEIPDDDPLKMAKLKVSKSAPGFRLFTHKSSVDWEGPFVWLLCVNEEDGLKFRLLQHDDKRELRVFWSDTEIDDIAKIDTLLRAHPFWNVLRLRAIVVLQARVEEQLRKLESGISLYEKRESHADIAADTSYNIRKLMDLEETLLLHAYQEFELQKIELAESKTVMEYLGEGKHDDTTAP